MKITFRCPPELKDRLPKPYPARRGLPDWLRAMPMSAPSPELGQEINTVKHCPPFLDAMSHGFLIPLAADLKVDGDFFEWDWGEDALDGEVPVSDLGWYPKSPMGFHVNAQVSGTPYFEEGFGLIKFYNFWTIELPPGYSLLASHPVNRRDLPFHSLTGLVDCDRYSVAFVHFPAVWQDRDFRGVLPKGTPIVQCLPVKRQDYELVFDELTGEAADRFVAFDREHKSDPHLYKNRYRAKKD
jgi:hypothetical protein